MANFLQILFVELHFGNKFWQLILIWQNFNLANFAIFYNFSKLKLKLKHVITVKEI